METSWCVVAGSVRSSGSGNLITVAPPDLASTIVMTLSQHGTHLIGQNCVPMNTVLGKLGRGLLALCSPSPVSALPLDSTLGAFPNINCTKRCMLPFPMVCMPLLLVFPKPPRGR